MLNPNKSHPRPLLREENPQPRDEKHLIFPLPDYDWWLLGEELVLPPSLQRTLLRYVQYRLRYGTRGRSLGLLVFYGPPGTGKSDTKYWLADRAARMLGTSGNALVVQAAPLFDENLGRSQKLIKELFADIALSARRGLTFVLIHDAETLFLSRSHSFAKNGDPSDVAKATTEFLHGLDRLRYGNVIILASLNLDGVVDPAIESRSDLVIRFALPDAAQRFAILAKQMRGLAGERVFAALTRATEGWNGRKINQLEMLAYINGTADELEALTPENFLRAAGLMPDSDVGRDEQPTPEVQEENECTRLSPNPFMRVITRQKNRWSLPLKLF